MMSLDDVLISLRGVPEFYFLEGEITVDTCSFTGDYPLNIVCVWGDVDAIRILIENGADIDRKGQDGYTPLHNAVEQGNANAVTFLLKRGANILVKNNFGVTPLKLAELLKEKNIYNIIQHYSEI